MREGEEDEILEVKDLEAPATGEPLDLSLLDTSSDTATAPAEALYPDVSVDELLGAALMPESLEALTPSTDNAEARPSFQLRLPALVKEAKDKLQALASAHGLELSDSTWSAATPILTQLTEFQAISFLRAARSQGFELKAEVIWPFQPSPTEEDLALGSLANTADPSTLQAEGAPSVALAEKDVLLLTVEEAAGYYVRQTFGIATAHRSIARHFFRQEELEEHSRRELQLLTRTATLPGSRLSALFHELFLSLQKNALALGGNAVIGLRIEAFPETSNLDPSLEEMRLVAFGTAAVVEKA